MCKIKTDLFLPEAMTQEVALGNSKLKSASAKIPKDSSESLLSEKQIKIRCKLEILQRGLLQHPYAFPLKKEKKTEPQGKTKVASKKITTGSICRAGLWPR